MKSLDELLNDEHLQAKGFFSVVDHPTEGKIRTMAVPSRWSVSQPQSHRHAPVFAEHSLEVLREAGYTDGEISHMLSTQIAAAAVESR